MGDIQRRPSLGKHILCIFYCIRVLVLNKFFFINIVADHFYACIPKSSQIFVIYIYFALQMVQHFPFLLKKSITLSFVLRLKFTWSFFIANLQISIIGAEFFNEFNLFVDMQNHRLVGQTTGSSFTGIHYQCLSKFVSYSGNHYKGWCIWKYITVVFRV